MKCYPSSALQQLEFEKIRELLIGHCRSEGGRDLAKNLGFHTRMEYLETALKQSFEFKQLVQHGLHFPLTEVLNLKDIIHVLGIPAACLSTEQFAWIRVMADQMQSLFHWFDAERQEQYPALFLVLRHSHYERDIRECIDAVLESDGQVKDNASEALSRIRHSLYQTRLELRRTFDRMLQKWQQKGYTADIDEAFLNGRRVVAVVAESKRMVKGILHGESDTRKTAFIEPEETIELNNEVFYLESEERREIQRILRQLTAALAQHQPVLKEYQQILDQLDFIRGKAFLALDMDGEYPTLDRHAVIHLRRAYHPLLLVYNRRQGKPTVPMDLDLDDQQRMLVISGPNAGGKTVTMKTVGLIQLMWQAGLLVPVHPGSRLGLFKQLLIHIGDTQSLEFELSTYSSHLQHMKYFIEHANGRTLFFIDELGSGSDPNLGGAFAEVILEDLARKHAIGIVTTHYLNLKVMAGKVAGIVNGAMSFDDVNLQPLYKLQVGKPGSSYTFSIAQRIGLPEALINRARQLVDEGHFNLDKLLNQAEQSSRTVSKLESELRRKLKEAESAQQRYQKLLDKEQHQQALERQRLENVIKQEELSYLKDMERKLRQAIQDWKKAEDKNKAVKLIENLLFRRPERQAPKKAARQFQDKYEVRETEARIGDLVTLKTSRQVGRLTEIREKRGIVMLGQLPLNVKLSDLTVVVERPKAAQENSNTQ